MNWEALQAISEALGVIAVVITLVYLARSVQQNSQSLALAALRDITTQWNHWSSMLANSGDLADIVARGNRSYASLSECEALRYGAYLQSFFDIVESYRAQVVDLKVDKDIAVLNGIVRRRISIPGFVAWWDLNTADYDNEFVQWIEDIRAGA